MNETQQKIKIKLWCYGIVALVILLLPILSWYSFLMPESENQASWFQRSGSLMVIFSILIEFKLFSIYKYIHPGRVSVVISPYSIHSYQKTYKYISILNISMIVIGTLIWGYGDIITNNT